MNVQSGEVQATVLEVLYDLLDHPEVRQLRLEDTFALVDRLIRDHGRLVADLAPSETPTVNGGPAVLAAMHLLEKIAAKSLQHFANPDPNPDLNPDPNPDPNRSAADKKARLEAMAYWEAKWDDFAHVVLAKLQELLSTEGSTRSYTQLVSWHLVLGFDWKDKDEVNSRVRHNPE